MSKTKGLDKRLLFNSVSFCVLAIGILGSVGVFFYDPNPRDLYDKALSPDFREQYELVLNAYTPFYTYPLFLSCFLLLAGTAVLSSFGKLQEWNYLVVFISPPLLALIMVYFVFGGSKGGAAFGGVTTTITSYTLFKAIQLRYKSLRSSLSLIAVLLLLILLPAAVLSGYKVDLKAREEYNYQALNIIRFASSERDRAAKELLVESYVSRPPETELLLKKAFQLLQDSLRIQKEYHQISGDELRRTLEVLSEVHIGLNRYQEAEACLNQERLSASEFYGEKSIWVANIDLKLAELYYYKMGRKADAIEAATTARDLYVQEWGHNNKETQKISSMIVKWEGVIQKN